MDKGENPMNCTRFAAVLLLAVLFCGLTAPPCLAQTEDATISGRVTDATSAVVVGAAVQLQSADKGTVGETTTNEAGIYAFPAVHPGVYHMTVRKQGFREVNFVGLTANVQAHIEENFSLQVGSTTESVTVTADAVSLNTTDASVGTVVDQQFVDNMPLNGRSFQSLIYLTPGVVMTPVGDMAPGQFSVSGQRTDTNYFSVDGVSGNFGTSMGAVTLGQTLGGTVPGLTVGGGTNGLVSVDAMQEFRIQTSSFAPEFGRSPGAQISIVTKSGANAFHGTAYDYLRNDIFDARNWFDFAQPNATYGVVAPLPKPPLRQNDFGGTFSGPILKDKTFFFFSYEGLRLRQPNTVSGHTLTAQARTVCTGTPSPSTPCVGAALKPLVDGMPLPAPSAVSGDGGWTAPIAMAYSDRSSLDAISLRVDHNLTKNITLFARYNHSPSVASPHYFNQVSNTNSNMDTMTAGVTAAISANKVNDFRANWSRNTASGWATMEATHGALAVPNSSLFPPGYTPAALQAQLSLNSIGVDTSIQGGTLASNVGSQLNFVDTYAWTVGSHQLKFGFDYRRLSPSNGVHDFYQAEPFDYATFQAGDASFVAAGHEVPMGTKFENYSIFTQDTWRANNRLTLTYGFRWDINTPPVSTTSGSPIYAIQGIFDSSPCGPGIPSPCLAPVGTPLWGTKPFNIAPRIGIAYQMTPKTVLRGGFGLFYDLGYGGNLGSMAADFPNRNVAVTYGNIPWDFSNPAFQFPALSTTITPSTTLNAVDPHLKLPLTYQWNVAVERELGKNQSLSVTYLGANGQNLLRSDSIVPPGSVLDGGGGSVSVTRNGDVSHYQAMQVQYKRRMVHGLQALISYSLAKSTDTNSSDINGMPAASISQVIMPPMAPSDFDVRNSFSAALSYEIPAPAWGKVGHAAMKGWALDGIVRSTSGRPLNVYMFNSFRGSLNFVQPDVVPGQPFWIPAPGQPEGRVLNPAAFAIPTGFSGDLPRNSLRGFGMDQTDLALRRRFNLTERVKLDIRAEYFNIFNHPMFGDPQNDYGFPFYAPLPGFGTIQAGNTLNSALGGGGFMGGQNALYAPGGSRSGQFTLKIIF